MVLGWEVGYLELDWRGGWLGRFEDGRGNWKLGWLLREDWVVEGEELYCIICWVRRGDVGDRGWEVGS